MPPPIATASAFATSACRTSIFDETFAPPTIARNGRSGSASRLERTRTSFSRSRPAYAGSRCATPSVEACARWAAPNASFTYRSNGSARRFANAASLRSSSAWNRTFSRSETPSGISTPTQSARSGTSEPRSSPSRAATGASDSEASRPFGRPRCEQRAIARAPRSRRSSMVGSAARILVSSSTLPFARGTLKSTRTRTRLPSGDASATVRKAIGARRTLGGDGLAQLRGDERGDVGEPARVAPFVVVPSDDLDHVAEDDRVHAAHDRRVLVPLEVARDERLLRVIHDPAELALGGRAECGVHLVLRHVTPERRGEVDDGYGGSRYTEGHAGEFAFQLGDDEGDRARGARLGGHDVLRGGASVARIGRRGVEQLLRQGLRVDRREEPLLDAEPVIQYLRDRREAVRRARRVADDVVLVGVELLLVDAEHDRLVLVLRGRGDDHFSRARVDVRLRLRRVREEPRRLDHDVDAKLLPGELRGVPLLEDADAAAVDRDRVGGRRHLALVLAVVRVVLEEVCVHLRIGEVVQRDDLDVGMALEECLEVLPADTPEPVDSDLRHANLPWRGVMLEEPFSASGRTLACCKDGAEESDVRAERGGYDGDGGRGHAERTRLDRAPHRLEHVGRLVLRDGPADDDERRIQRVRESHRQVAEGGLRAFDERAGPVVAGGGRGVHALGVRDAELLREIATGRERLGAAEGAAAAGRPFERDREVAQLAGRAARAAQHPAAAHDLPAETGRHGDVHEIGDADRGAGDRLADRGHRGVVVDEDSEAAERRGDAAREREFDHSDEVRSLMHDSAAEVQGTRGRASGERDIAERASRPLERRAGRRCELADDVVGTGARRPPRVAPDDPRDRHRVLGDDAADVRAAEIEPEKVRVGQTLGSRRSVPSAAASPITVVCTVLYPRFALSLPKVCS